MSTSLHEQRVHAADRSGGTSHPFIKTMVIDIIKKNHFGGNVLDYGAGKGELLEMLKRENLFQSLAGADIMARPAHLDPEIAWYEQDLNEPLRIEGTLPDLVICSEVIEHLENPRATFRELHQLLAPGSHLLLTMPNQECIRSFFGLLFGGHFVHFLGNSYPAHITALLRLDLKRICEETGFTPPTFYYTDRGGIPKKPSITWQKLSFGLLRGRLYSDNLAIVTQKK